MALYKGQTMMMMITVMMINNCNDDDFSDDEDDYHPVFSVMLGLISFDAADE